jgi:hypothetical protein
MNTSQAIIFQGVLSTPLMTFGIKQPRVNIFVGGQEPEQEPARVPTPEPVPDELIPLDEPAPAGGLWGITAADRDAFWNVISTFEWTNRGVARVDPRRVAHSIARLTDVQLNRFAAVYDYYYQWLLTILDNDGMFVRVGVNTRSGMSAIVSHVIALGVETYGTLCGDLELLQWIVTSNEHQNMDILLPPGIRKG